MKLIRCYVENFGKLSRFSYDFSDGLNVILQENGFGKTTFAAFLKAMFYGLTGTGKTSVLINERKRYKPWQGGAFGGNLVFEQDGKCYLIERFFGEKDKDETFVLYDADTGAESHDYSEKIGEELFLLDAQAFEKSIFMPQQGLLTGANDSLLAKLTGEKQDERDIGHYESAINRLEKEKKDLIKIGEKGRIWELRHQITQLECQLLELGRLEEHEQKYRIRQQEVETELENLGKKRKMLSDELEAAGAYERNQAIISHFRAVNQEFEEKKAEYESACAFFSKESLEMLPTEADFARVFDKLSQYQSVSQEVSVKEVQCENLYQNLKEAKSEKEQCVRQEEAFCIGDNEEENRNDTLYYVVGVLIAILGIGLIFVNGLAGLVVFAGAVFFLGIRWNRARVKQKAAQERKRQREQQMSLLKERCQEAAEKYDVYKAKWQDLKTETEVILHKKETLEKEIRDFVLKLQPWNEMKENQFVTVLSEIKQHVGQCHLLKDEMEKKRMELYRFNEEHKDKLQMASDLMDNMSDDFVTPKSLFQIKKEQAECEQCQQQLVEERSQILRQLEKVSNQLEQGQDDLAQQKHAQVELQELEERYQILDKTVMYLEKAKERFSLRYLDQIKEHFQEYMELLNQGTCMESVLDTKLKLKVTQAGSKKDVDCFSAGYKDLMYLCMRFALVDAVCEQGGFLILDDPFVNLDKIKVEQGLFFLKKLSEKYQILYLTCHESRC